MLKLKNILCWLGDGEDHKLLERLARTGENEATAEVVLGENKPYIAYWKCCNADSNAEASKLPTQCKMHVRHGHLSRRCVGTLDIDPTRPETLEGSSDGMLYGEVPLMTMRADKSSKLLGSIIIEFYLAQDGEDSEEDNNPYASFKFTFRKSSSPNRRSYGIEGASASSSKRQRDSEEASDQESARTKTEPTRKKRPSRIPKRPSRIHKRPRRYTSSDDELSESRSSLANLVSDALKLKDERVAIEKEERELRFLLEKRNSELREQNQTRRADLADAKRAISGIV